MEHVFNPKPSSKIRVNKRVVSIALPKELIKPFHEICAKNNITPSRLGLQCIQFAFDHMPKSEG